jgi:RNA polymerase sigma factor (sigma-70 family)
LQRQIIEGQEPLVDRYEDYEEKEQPSEDIAALHFQRIQAIPVLTEAEEADLLQRWCTFRDEKAKDRIVLAHMRMVPPIAREAAFKAGFDPNFQMMAGAARWTAGLGLNEVVSDLTAAGNEGLVLAVNGYRLGWDVKFYTYAKQCVRREIWKQATFLRSAVRRKDGGGAKWDLSIDPALPDVHDTRVDCGSRANPSVGGSDLKDNSTDWQQANPQTRFGPELDEPILESFTKDEQIIIGRRMQGLSLREVAEELGLSTATVWRREQSAINRVRAENGKANCRSATRDSSAPRGRGFHE